MATNGASATKVVTGKVRLSYVHLDKPYTQDEDSEPKYSCMLLIPKSDKATLKKLNAAIAAAKEAGKTSRWNGKIPGNLHITLRDADEELDLEKQPEAKGCMFMNVSAKTQPGIVDKQVQPILDMTEVYSGMYARVSINAFPYSGKSNGVSFGLNHVQKVADGEFLGGRSKAEDDFDELPEDDDDLI